MFYEKNQNPTPALPSELYESNLMSLFQKYLDENTKTGYLLFQVYHQSPIYGRLPVANARITLCKSLGDGYYVCKIIMTDMDGETEPMPLPTVSAELSQSPGNVVTNAVYDISVEAPNFVKAELFDISVFENITSIQSVDLLPIIEPVSQSNQNTNGNGGGNDGNHQQTY